MKMANFRYWGYSIENYISWMKGSEHGKFQILGVFYRKPYFMDARFWIWQILVIGIYGKFQIWGYTTKSHVLVIACSENGKFQILGFFYRKQYFIDARLWRRKISDMGGILKKLYFMDARLWKWQISDMGVYLQK